PCFQLVGNHDVWDIQSQNIYEKRYGKLWYSKVHKNALFVFLNSDDFINSPDMIIGSQYSWLEKELAKNKDLSFKFIFLHKPLWSTSPDWNQRIHPLLIKYGVSAVFAGHVHSYYKFPLKDGIPYYVSGGGGAEVTNTTQKEGAFHHFLAVTVGEDEFSVKVIRDKKILPDTVVVADPNNPFALFRNKGLELSNIITTSSEFNNCKPGITSNNSQKIEIVSLNEQFTVTAKIKNTFLQPITGIIFWTLRPGLWQIPADSTPFSLNPGQELEKDFELKLMEKEGVFKTPDCAAKISMDQETVISSKKLHYAKILSFIPKIDVPPFIDGLIDENTWEQAAVINLYGNKKSQKNTLQPDKEEDSIVPIARPTSARIAIKGNLLYMAIRCLEPKMEELAAQATVNNVPFYSSDDYVEINLDNPDIPGFYKILINANGAIISTFAVPGVKCPLPISPCLNLKLP
ncbi:MAG: metallophosphoesterase, partial [bacterium]